MATLIEDQIHQHFIALEAAKAQAEGRKPRPVPKPWTRSPQGMCPSDFLSVVKEYDYRLEDAAFQAYCRSRGVLHVAGVKDSRRWQFFAEHSKAKDEYVADPYFQFAEESQGTRYKYTAREMEVGWGIIELGRGVLQDCWELYQAQMLPARG
jgi:hypothetical protein